MIQYYHNFDDLNENCDYVSENKLSIIGQGLYICYDVIVLGTGLNKYTLILTDDHEEYIFETKDDFITKWRVRSFPEDINGTETINFMFEAFGILRECDQYYINSCNIGNCSIFSIGNKTLTLKQIIFEIEDESLVPLSAVLNCNVYYDKFLSPRYAKIHEVQNEQVSNEPGEKYI